MLLYISIYIIAYINRSNNLFVGLFQTCPVTADQYESGVIDHWLNQQYNLVIPHDQSYQTFGNSCITSRFSFYKTDTIVLSNVFQFTEETHGCHVWIEIYTVKSRRATYARSHSEYPKVGHWTKSHRKIPFYRVLTKTWPWKTSSYSLVANGMGFSARPT